MVSRLTRDGVIGQSRGVIIASVKVCATVDAGSLSLRVIQKIGTRELMRILLVEDDLDLAQFIRKGLKQ